MSAELSVCNFWVFLGGVVSANWAAFLYSFLISLLFPQTEFGGMDAWNTDLGAESPLPLPLPKKTLENELVELLWENGDIVLHGQTNKKQNYDPSKSKQEVRDPTSLIQDDETSLWIDCPIDESFERDFCADFFSEIPSFDESEKSDKFGASDVNHVVPRVDHEYSGLTIGSSNQVVNENLEAYARLSDGMERETITSCSGGSGSSLWRTSSQSNDTNKHKRKSRELEESECPSGTTTRRSRVAEVHNMSEKKRRDRINEKMRALQELIPHSNKSDKASVLDEAIEYMKFLQLQIQLMWMGRGIGPMIFPGITPRGGPAMLPVFQNLTRFPRLSLVDQPQASHSAMVNYQNHMHNYLAFHSMQNTSPQGTNMFHFGFNLAQRNEVSAAKRKASRSVG